MLTRALAAVDRPLRKAALYAYAFNQSRAKVLTDPLYLAVATVLLRGDVPLSPRLQKQQFDDNLFFAYREQSRKLQYFIEDWDFTQARPDLLTPRQRQMMHTVALGETSGSAVADSFLRAFRTQPELAAFFGTWFTEELNHFLGYHAYLERMGERWPAQRGLDVAQVDFIPYAATAIEVAACNMYQELLGFLIYRSFARQVKDPFLARMLQQFAKDELRHYKFYQNVVARHIQRDPDFRRVVLKVILKATSPYNQVSGGADKVLDHLQMGAFYFRAPEYDYFLAQVDYLLGTPLRPFFDWFFRGVAAPCTVCREELVRCSCESYEDDQPAPTRHPTWWKEASTPSRSALDDVDWTAQLFARAQDGRREARASEPHHV